MYRQYLARVNQKRRQSGLSPFPAPQDPDPGNFGLDDVGGPRRPLSEKRELSLRVEYYEDLTEVLFRVLEKHLGSTDAASISQKMRELRDKRTTGPEFDAPIVRELIAHLWLASKLPEKNRASWIALQLKPPYDRTPRQIRNIIKDLGLRTT